MWDPDIQAWIDPLAQRVRGEYGACQEAATQARTRQVSETHAVRRRFCDQHAAAHDLGDPRAWA
jgi:hypothetical protein